MQTPDNQKLFPKYEEELQDPIAHDETANRQLSIMDNHIYQNKTGKIMYLTIYVEYDLNRTQGLCEADIIYDSVTPPVKFFCGANFKYTNAIAENGETQALSVTLTAIIPPNYYYKLDNSSSNSANVSIGQWIEVY